MFLMRYIDVSSPAGRHQTKFVCWLVSFFCIVFSVFFFLHFCLFAVAFRFVSFFYTRVVGMLHLCLIKGSTTQQMPADHSLATSTSIGVLSAWFAWGRRMFFAPECNRIKSAARTAL